jgi:hypothetical protein
MIDYHSSLEYEFITGSSSRKIRVVCASLGQMKNQEKLLVHVM